MLSISDAQVEGSAELITDPLERRDTLDRFRAKYGPEQYARWYKNAARVLRVRLGVPRAPADGGERYYGWLASEFDNIADDYDRHILGNRINRLLRDRSLAELRRVFGRASRLLEIGCGSGMETLPLLGEGHEIFCVDISERMLEVVRQKARKQGVAERLQTAKLAAAALPQFLDQVGPAAFDGAYSTYGAMNCEADLAPLPPALHGLLRPGARFVAGVYNRWCAFELLGYPSPGSSTGRSGAPVDRYGSAPPGSASMSTPTRRRRSGGSSHRGSFANGWPPRRSCSRLLIWSRTSNGSNGTSLHSSASTEWSRHGGHSPSSATTFCSRYAVRCGVCDGMIGFSHGPSGPEPRGRGTDRGATIASGPKILAAV